MIVTHTSPDWDAITAAWLLQRYGNIVGPVVFVNTGNPDPAVLQAATAVVDTGRELDAARLRFDHHHLSGDEQRTCCATSLVFDHIQAPDYLRPLIDLVTAGDTGQRAHGADVSRTVGIHALLSAKKAQHLSDADLLVWGYETLDLLAEGLKARHEATATLAAHTVYRSVDGLLVALKDAPRDATFAAFEAGARLVLFQAGYDRTNAVGIQRAGEWQEPHCGALVEAVLDEWVQPGSLVSEELTTWFKHPAGFFAGRGTEKAPDPRPVLVALETIAQAIDLAWKR